MNERQEFLTKMYDQMFADINRNILVLWQSVGVVAGAIAAFALVEKQVVPVDYIATFVVGLAAWLIAHTYEATYWYNRNLVIIANIERQFLKQSDLRDIHYYFGKHRDANKMLDQFKIQYALGVGIALLFLIYHFETRIVPGFAVPLEWKNVELRRTLPYVGALILAVLILVWKRRYAKKYQEFLTNSPGIDINTAGITYGIGHPAYLGPQKNANAGAPTASDNPDEEKDLPRNK